jgi:hypothetical protein
MLQPAAAAAIASIKQQQKRWPARALLQNYIKPLKTEDEPYGAVGAPNKWMYRLVAGKGLAGQYTCACGILRCACTSVLCIETLLWLTCTGAGISWLVVAGQEQQLQVRSQHLHV